MQTSCPPYTTALLRHFVDLRDRTHHGVTDRSDKERLFTKAVALVDPHARQTLEEINTCLMLDTGKVTASGIRHSPDGDADAMWALSWPLQQAAGIDPIVIHAFFGRGFLHPHLRSGTAGDWPLNVYDEEQAAAELPTLRAIASTDIHNLVFHLGGDVRIIPAILDGRTP
jgi:hypothetical protein